MRKILVFAVFVFAVFCVVPVHAQFKFGLKAGVEFSDLSVDDAFESTNGMGFFIGPTVKVKLPLGGLGVDASVLYDWYEAEIEDVANSDRRINEQHINIPVNLRYAFGLGETASFFIYAGPQVGFSIGNRHQGFFDGWQSGTRAVPCSASTPGLVSSFLAACSSASITILYAAAAPN